MDMKFSIIMPVFNVEKYIEQAIKSVVEQSYTDFELIIVDDGSTDNSGNICDIYADSYSAIHVIHQENRGLSSARNTGIMEAKGEYLIFLDSDDWLPEESLCFIQQSTIDKPDIILNRVYCYDENTHELKECNYQFSNQIQFMTINEIFQYCIMLPDFWAAAWMIVCSAEYLRMSELYFKEGIFHEDEEWSPKTILNARSISFNNNCVYSYRSNRQGSIIQTPNIKKELDKLTIIDLLLKESQKSKYSKGTSKLYKKRCSSIYSGVLQKNAQYFHCYEYNTLKELLREKRKVLLYSQRPIHALMFFMSLFFGPHITSKIIGGFKDGD